jgi:hypothetical protein
MKTAVEWLFSMLNNPNRDQNFSKKLLKKAKEIELDQHKYSFEHGFYCGRHTEGDRIDAWNYYMDNLKSE